MTRAGKAAFMPLVCAMREISLLRLIALFGGLIIIGHWIRKVRDRKRCSKALNRLWASGECPRSAVLHSKKIAGA